MITSFSEFKLGDIIRITPGATGKGSVIGKVIAINLNDQSVAFIDPDTKSQLGAFMFKPAGAIRTFEIIEPSKDADEDVVAAQAKIGVWLAKFDKMASYIKANFPLTLTGALTAKANANLNEAIRMLNPLLTESYYLPLSPETRKKADVAFTDLAGRLNDILELQQIRRDAISAIYDLLLFIPEIIGAMIVTSGKYFGQQGERFWDWLTGDWKRMAVAGVITAAAVTGGYLYIKAKK
ncbi:MAG: hypothetical protein V1701_03000 [Planctomycetota bacterium]